jgi:hypothetical protein
VKQREAMFSYTLIGISFYYGVINDSIILILQVIMDFIKSEPNSDSEACLTLSHSENGIFGIKEEDDPLLITSPVIKTENEVMFCFALCISWRYALVSNISGTLSCLHK